jgi:hypothetical protein
MAVNVTAENADASAIVKPIEREKSLARSRRSARQAGTKFETDIAKYLNEHVDDRIERRTLGGNKDRGDIGGLRHMGQRIVIEAKNTSRINLGSWMNEAHTAMGNDDAGLGIIVHKRHGKGQPGDQWVTMTLDDLIALITGQPRSLP